MVFSIAKSKLYFLCLFLTVFVLHISAQQEIYFLECQTESDAFISKDRKAWNSDPARASESYQHNFDIPSEHPDGIECLTLRAIEIEFNQSSESSTIPTSPTGTTCFFGYYSHVLACNDYGNFICDESTQVNGNNGIPGIPSSPETYFYLDDGFENGYELEDLIGTTIGFDFIPIIETLDEDCRGCWITSGDYETSYEVCVSLIYEFDEPEDELELPDEAEFCFNPNDLFEFDAPNDYEQYDWTDNDGNLVYSSGEEEFPIPAPGQYTLLVTDENGCTQEDEIEFNALDVPPVAYTETNPLVSCGSRPDTIYPIIYGEIANSDYDFSWLTPRGSTVNRDMLTPTDTGTYILMYEDKAFDCVFIDEFHYSRIETSPAQIDSISLPSVSICEGSTTFLEAFVPYEDDNFYNFNWIQGTDTLRTKTIQTTAAGRYYLIMQDTLGCSATIDSIDVILTPNLSAGVDVTDGICPTGPVDLNDFISSEADDGGFWIDRDSGTNIPSLVTGASGQQVYGYVISNSSPCINDTAYIELLFPEIVACNDSNDCTINDMSIELADGTICAPCEGITLDCDSGVTIVRACNDGDPNTVNDMETILECDDSICVPCAGEPADCSSGTPMLQPCDDLDPCTIDDMESILPDGTICETCRGTSLDCDNGDTTTRPCDDLDPNTINDMETVLDCDGSICVPCSGTEGDCDTGILTTQACDDLDDCTIDDLVTILPSGEICIPCAGTALDCDTGNTITRPCDDGDDNTINDMETILECDESPCVPCAGQATDCDNSETEIMPCDDGNDCTMNDIEIVLSSDGSICEPCRGITIDCNNGNTVPRMCDDGNDNTIDDIEMVLECDMTTICVPCQGEFTNCASSETIVNMCDDQDPCTFDDIEVVLASDGTICEPCIGQMYDCNTGDTAVTACDDGDDNTVDDVQTVLECDMSTICVPCAGTLVDCDTGIQVTRPCNDMNDCTINDVLIILTTGEVCEPCMGTQVDCTSGPTLTKPCDDGNPSTDNDMITVLECDETIICEPCTGQPIDCATGMQITQDCEDGDPCTVNDTEVVLADGTICEPCQGEILDCTNNSLIRPCDDGDPSTINDEETVLECDESVICIPCSGQPGDCLSLTTITESCDDGLPCTINDTREVLADGTVCIPCLGERTDCDNGEIETRMCDDGDPTTIDDQETILVCDQSVCVECRGITKELSIYIPSMIALSESGENNSFRIYTTEVAEVNEMSIWDRWGNQVFSISNTTSDDPELTWDGRYKGEPALQGVYIYRIKYRLSSNLEPRIKFGELTVIR